MNEKKMKCIKFSFFNLLLFLSLILSNLNISSILKTSEFRILKKKEKKTYSVKFFFFIFLVFTPILLCHANIDTNHLYVLYYHNNEKGLQIHSFYLVNIIYNLRVYLKEYFCLLFFKRKIPRENSCKYVMYFLFFLIKIMIIITIIIEIQILNLPTRLTFLFTIARF